MTRARTNPVTTPAKNNIKPFFIFPFFLLIVNYYSPANLATFSETSKFSEGKECTKQWKALTGQCSPSKQRILFLSLEDAMPEYN